MRSILILFAAMSFAGCATQRTAVVSTSSAPVKNPVVRETKPNLSGYWKQ